MRAKLQGLSSPSIPGTSAIEEEIRTLPHVVRQPRDLKRGDRHNMLLRRNLEQHRRQSKKTRANWRAPDCSTFTLARLIRRRGVQARPLRTREQPYGIRSGPGALTAKELEDLEPHTRMMVDSLNSCIIDVREGRATILESPADAITWALDEAIELYNMPGVVDILLDNCMFGGLRRKGTRLRTNVPELIQLFCLCKGPMLGICDRTGQMHLPW